MESRYSHVTIRETQLTKKVRIGSKLKPEIISQIIDKWQMLLNLLASVIDIPAALIMRLNEETIEVYLKNENSSNPYEVGEEVKLLYGLYCETVIGTQKRLLIENATISPVWKLNNPDIDLNMISYLGYPVNWPDGEVFGTICILDNKENQYNKIYEELLYHVKLDVETDLGLLVTNQNLSEKSQQLERLNTIKSKFLSLISHDLRSIIGSHQEYLRIILSKLDSADIKDLQKMLHEFDDSISYIYTTLETLLSWSKTDLLQLEPNKTALDLVLVIEKILNFFSQTIQHKKIQLTKEYSADEVYVFADRDMIEAALRNIISNAIKYTEPYGQVAVRLFKDNKRCIIEIEDTGIGMKEETLDKLFTYNPSYTAEGTNGESSSGIGLFLTKEFLELNNASIDANSELGKGTKIVITV
jgi:K+-sensing histidine kinase KdpD